MTIRDGVLNVTFLVGVGIVANEKSTLVGSGNFGAMFVGVVIEEKCVVCSLALERKK